MFIIIVLSGVMVGITGEDHSGEIHTMADGAGIIGVTTTGAGIHHTGVGEAPITAMQPGATHTAMATHIGVTAQVAGDILTGVMVSTPIMAILIEIGIQADILKIGLRMRTHVEAVLIPQAEQQIQEFIQEIPEALILQTRVDLQTLTMPAQVAHIAATV